MKNKGKKFTLSSLLTVLGVVCFLTTIVAATPILSNTLTVDRTPADHPLVIAGPNVYSGGDFITLPATGPIEGSDYAFVIHVAAASGSQAAVIHVTVTGGTLSKLEYKTTGSWTPLATTGGSIPSDTYAVTGTDISIHVVYSSLIATQVTFQAQDT